MQEKFEEGSQWQKERTREAKHREALLLLPGQRNQVTASSWRWNVMSWFSNDRTETCFICSLDFRFLGPHARNHLSFALEMWMKFQFERISLQYYKFQRVHSKVDICHLWIQCGKSGCGWVFRAQWNHLSYAVEGSILGGNHLSSAKPSSELMVDALSILIGRVLMVEPSYCMNSGMIRPQLLLRIEIQRGRMDGCWEKWFVLSSSGRIEMWSKFPQMYHLSSFSSHVWKTGWDQDICLRNRWFSVLVEQQDYGSLQEE